MTTEVSGSAPLICVAAAIPLPGMLMSSRQTSGRSRLAPSTAPAASAASTQTWKSPVRSSALRTSARVRAWSSANRTVMGVLIANATATRVPRSGTESTLSTRAHRGRPLLHALEPEAARRRRSSSGSNPQPSSSITSRSCSSRSRLTRTCSEAPWLAALVMASRTMRSRFSRDLAGHLDVVGQLEVPGHAEARPEVLHRLGDGGIERLRLRDREHGDGPPGLVEGPIGRTGQVAGVVRRRRAGRGAAGLAGDEGQLVGQAVVQLAGDAPALLDRGLLLERAVGGPVGERELEEVAQGDAAVDALLRDGGAPGGDGRARRAASRRDRPGPRRRG